MCISFYSNDANLLFIFSLFNQNRSFKTYRSVISDTQRNPTILSRLKDAYGTQGTKLEVNSGSAQTLQSETLSKLLSQETANLTTEQKQHLKIAFAEGYLAASHPDNAHKGGRTMKYLKVSISFIVILSLRDII